MVYPSPGKQMSSLKQSSWPGTVMKPLTPKSDIKPVTGHKRMRSPNEGKVRKDVRNTNIGIEPENNKDKNTLAEEIESGKYGSATGAIKNLLEMKEKMFNPIYTPRSQVLQSDQLPSSLSKQVSGQKSGTPVQGHSLIIILDSDDEEIGESTSSNPSHSIANTEPVVDIQVKETDETYCSREHKLMERQVDDDAIRKDRDIYLSRKNATHVELDHHSSSKMAKDISGNEINDKESTCIGLKGSQEKKSNHQIDSNSVMLVADNGFKGDDCVSVDMEINNDDTVIEDVNQQTKLDKTSFYGDSEVEDGELNEQIVSNCDDLEGIWKEMNLALELSKVDVDIRPEECLREEIPDCDHSFVLKEDLGYVCRVCGVIQRRIETIIEYQFAKNTRSTRTYYREAQITNSKDAQFFYDGSKLSGQEIPVDEFNIHPLHMKQMKPHQLEGFQFLQNNLVIDNPGGCILAHAPGSGKTFMIISFIQSFLAKYPQARPLVVLPKGILSTWKNEFKRWQIEDIPLYDFYSMKADSRVQQLEVLKQWAGQKSILFIGYQQFSLIVCDDEANETTASCQKFLLQTPSILILDEGHTPRNEETDVLSSLKKVQTSRKVVLSGTLYQNHVKEVFNIFDLVRPKFLKQPSSRAIIKRILSKVSSTKKHENLENSFYESVESTLRNDNIFKRKIAVIQDLREMTSKVLHFYKGDFLDELPGILDFTVYLKLSKKQKEGVKELKKLNQRFKVISEGCALYVHPNLRNHLKKASRKEREGLEVAKMDQAIDNSDINDGVKSKFFLNLLSLCESTGEKILVFGQYIQPLKFLERLTVKSKGWCVGKEIFVITGDSSSESRDSSMEQFNKSAAARVFFGSIKACGEGISLVGASRIIILDVHLNPSVTRQAIGRAFRPGQERKVYVYRLVAAESPEEDDHSTCFRKESIAKMWFEWNECCGEREFEMRSLDVRECGDEFLESPKLSVDIKSLYQR